MGKPTLKQVLDTLKRQVLVGKSFLGIAKGLLGADPVILDGARTFFGLTLDGSVELAQMAIARLYDKARNTVTVRTMLYQAANEIDLFQRGEHQQKCDGILKSAHRVIDLQPILDAIRVRRNKWLAHLDPDTVRDPAALATKAKLSIPDLDLAFQETEKILLELSSLYEGVIGELQFLGGDDYKVALDWIRKAKCAYIERFEREHGVGSWTSARPKDCSRHPWDLM